MNKLSLNNVQKHGKVSLSQKKVSLRREKTVRELVEKYRKQFPDLERPLLRKMIRLEHREIFRPSSGKLRTLDRELKRSFKLKTYSLRPFLSNWPKLGSDSDFAFRDVLGLEIMLGATIEEAKKRAFEVCEAHRKISDACQA
jgi:hypothetical protein